MAIDFIDVIEAAPSTEIISAPAAISGLSLGSKSITIIGGVGQLSVNGGGWTTSSNVSNGDSVRLKITTPADPNGQVTTVTVSIASLSSYIDWTVTNLNNTLSDVGSAFDYLFAFKVLCGEVPDNVATVSDWTVETPYTMVYDAATVSDLATPAYYPQRVVYEFATGFGQALPVIGWVVYDEATASDTAFPAAGLTVLDAGVGTDTPFDQLTATNLVTETATGSETVFQSLTWTHDDASATVSDSVFIGGYAALLVLDAAAGADEATPSVTATNLVVEVGTVTDWHQIAQALMLNINNNAYGRGEAIIAPTDNRAWVANVLTTALCRWTGLSFTELHQVGDTVYALGPSGMYVLDTDSTVDASVETGVYDFGKAELKMLDVAYLAYTSQQALEIDAIASHNGRKTVTTYRRPALDHETPAPARLKFGRGREARYWAFVLRNTDLGKTTIQDLRVVPLVSSRRI